MNGIPPEGGMYPHYVGFSFPSILDTSQSQLSRPGAQSHHTSWSSRRRSLNTKTSHVQDGCQTLSKCSSSLKRKQKNHAPPAPTHQRRLGSVWEWKAEGGPGTPKELPEAPGPEMAETQRNLFIKGMDFTRLAESGKEM